MKKEMIANLLFNGTSSEQIEFATNCSNEEDLFLFAYNYNWGDGFSIPSVVINNPACTLSVALMVFYAGDGYSYLLEKPESSEMKEWFAFITDLYAKIKGCEFKAGETAFTVPLTKVQIFKLNKTLTPEEKVFITNIDGINCNIDL